jgi:uncharacterized protein
MTSANNARLLACPVPNVENRHFWEAAGEGRLTFKSCRACGRDHFYPRAICPHCFSDQTEWRESAGLGSIYTFSVMRRVPAPYAIAYIALDEGVTLMSNIVDCDLDRIAIGQRVKVTFRPSDGSLTVPVFVLA